MNPRKLNSGAWRAHVACLTGLLEAVSFRLADGREIGAEAGFRRWRGLTRALRRKRGTIFLIGNGASASMASHLAADLAKNAHVHTEVFSDLSLITAISNDLGYARVFSEPLSRRARRGDLLVAISSSGRSPNILAAVQVARRNRLSVVTLSAMKPGNPLRRRGTLNIYVPAATYGFAESAHAAILHHWMDLVEKIGA
jgi:D-sedoheptulose 7-phosphate isomerase